MAAEQTVLRFNICHSEYGLQTLNIWQNNIYGETPQSRAQRKMGDYGWGAASSGVPKSQLSIFVVKTLLLRLRVCVFVCVCVCVFARARPDAAR